MTQDNRPVKDPVPDEHYYAHGPASDPGFDPWDERGTKWAEDYDDLVRGAGKVDPEHPLPNNIAAEASLLGSMLLSENARDAGSTLTADDFYKPGHGHIYAAIRALQEKGQGVDIVTVSAQLGGLLEPAGGQAYIAGLIADTPTTSNAPSYATIVRDCSRRRKQILVADQLTNSAQAGLPTADYVGMLEDLEGTSGTTSAVRLGDTLSDYVNLLEARWDGTAPRGIATGISRLDNATGGFRPGQLITYAARPGCGKSDMACQTAFNTSSQEIPTLFVSIEMSLEELQDRWMSEATRIKHARLRAGTIGERDWTVITDGVSKLVDIPLYVHDDPNANLATIRHEARRIPGIGLVIVDYMQLMDSIGQHESRQNEVAALSRGLKRLARDLECPVIALSQLNRGVESRNDKRPQLADLRESGAIEQDSDVVIGLFREDLYDSTKSPGSLEAIILKHRTAPLGPVHLLYDPTTSTIHSPEEAAA